MLRTNVMKHLHSVILFALLAATPGVRAEQKHPATACFEKRNMAQPVYIKPIKDAALFEKPLFEKNRIESSQEYVLERIKPEWEKSTFEKSSFEGNCSAAPAKAPTERSYSTQSATTVASTRNGTRYTLSTDGKISLVSRSAASKRVKVGTMASTACRCELSAKRVLIGSDTGLASK